jgi:hypothetical protein
MVRDLKPQPKMPSNYCCLGCCGKASGPVDVNKIVADGGKFLQTSDGRIVEYFVYGAEAAERTLVQINGSMGTGWFCMSIPGMVGRTAQVAQSEGCQRHDGRSRLYTSWQPNNFGYAITPRTSRRCLLRRASRARCWLRARPTAARSRSPVPATSANVSRICTCIRLTSRTSCVSSLCRARPAGR